jgi:hypothetical protein
MNKYLISFAVFLLSVNGHATAEGSRISFTYHVHGFLQDGFAGLAPAVDGVIGEQLTRLGERLARH